MTKIYHFLIGFLYLCTISAVPANSGKLHSLSQGVREVDFKVVYKVAVSDHVSSLKLKMVVPADIQDRQKINKMKFSVRPDTVYKMNNNTYAIFVFSDVTKDFKLTMKGQMTLYNTIKLQADGIQSDLSQYLVAEQNIEVSNEKIIALAATLKQRTDIETIMKTFDYVSNHINYKIKDAVGAAKVLELGAGKCMDYSDLFVALLRANNIPAKSVFGMVVDVPGSNPLHAWPEAYLKKQGWVRFDPTTGNSEIIPNGNNYKLRISNSYITLSEGRNDPELNTSLFTCYTGAGDINKIKLNSSFDLDGQ